MDIAKAFDTVSHAKLATVVKSYGINSEVCQWIKEFLSNRYQQVCVGDAVSSPVSVSSGVPQGGVIGPLLFVIYIDGLMKFISNSTRDVMLKLFADDSKLYGDESASLQEAINAFFAWTKNRQLRVAPQKCFHLSLHKNRSLTNPETFTINATTIENKTSVCDLGIIVNENMKWKQHCDYIYRKASQTSYQILKCFGTRNIWVLIHLFKTYIRPKLEFNSSVWSPYLKKDIARIESVQKRFTRYSFLRCGLTFSSYTDRLRQVNLQTLEERRLITDLVLLFKIVNDMSDMKFLDYFVFNRTNYNLRRNSLQISPLKNHNSDQWTNSFFVRVTRVWNALPEEIVKASSLSKFKSLIVKHDVSNFITLDSTY